MKILLCAVNAKYIQTSLSVRCLSRFADNEQIDTAEYTINENAMNTIADIYRKNPDILMLSCYIWNIEYIRVITREIVKLLPLCKIVLGGPEVSHDANGALLSMPEVYAVMRGEGELILSDFINNDCRADGVRGMSFRSNDGITHNPDMPLICDMSSLPFPYTDEDIEENKNKLIYYESSRGCPFKCSYCLSSTVHGVRFRRIDLVFDELMFFIHHNVGTVKFVDRTFNADRKRTYEIINFLIDNAGNTTFHFEISADLLTDDIINLLKTAPDGLFRMEIGVQSTNPQTLAAINRKADFGKIADAVRKLMELGTVHIHLDLIAGLPYEDVSSFRRSFDDVLSLRPHVLQLGFLKLLKGTKIREQAKAFRYKYTDSPPYEILCNDRLAYDDILLMKNAEDILDKYYNSGAFTLSINYLLDKYKSPFSLFEDISSYFSKMGYNKISHSRKSLYKILLEFYDTKFNDKVFYDIVKYDYLDSETGRTSPEWSLLPYDKDINAIRMSFLSDEENIKRYLPEYTGIQARDIIKRIHFEPFLYDVTGDMNRKDILVVFDYIHGRRFSLKRRV